MNGKHFAIGIGLLAAAIGAAILPGQTVYTEFVSVFGLGIGGWIIGFVTGVNLDEDGYVRLNNGLNSQEEGESSE